MKRKEINASLMKQKLTKPAKVVVTPDPGITPTALPSSSLKFTLLLAERVMGWRVAPGRFLTSSRCWMPAWRFQPTKNLDNALALLDAADPDECIIIRRRGTDWSVSIRIGDGIGKAQDPSQARAITLAVAQAVGLDVSACD
jgi:hypothetical protein